MSLIEWLTATALAAPCEALDETEFRAYVFDAQSAIERGDAELTGAIVEQATNGLPCLTFAPEPTLWADLLVSMSIVAYSRSEDWQQLLTAALRIRSGIDRGVGPGHPIYSFEPGPPPAMGPPVPAKARIRLDGRPSPVLPPDKGVWLVQKTDGRYWSTLLLTDDPLPEGWASDPIDGPPRISAWVRLGGSLGGGGIGVVTGLDTPRFPTEPNEFTTGAPIGAQGDLHATFYSPFGVLVSGRTSRYPGSPGYDGRVSGIFERGALTLGAGVGLSTVDIVELGVVETDTLELFTTSPAVRYAVGTVVLHPHHRPIIDNGRPVDVALSVGGSRQGGMLDADAGIATPISDEQLVRFGVLAGLRTGTFGWTGVPGSRLQAIGLRLLIRVDFVFGEY